MITGEDDSRKARDSRNQNGNMVKMTGRNGPQICRTGITTLTMNGIMQRNWSDDRLC